jgi:predicted porin
MKALLLTTAMTLVVAGTASAVEVELYGQVNKGAFAIDDGRNTETVVVDNANDSSRFGLKGAKALDNGLTASVLMEGEVVDNASDSVTQNTTTPAITGTSSPNLGAGVFTSRQARVGLSGNFGGLYVGKQSTAIEGAYWQDLVGVADVMNASFNQIGGGFQFRNEVTGATVTSINSKTSLMDENRTNSVRYDSPIFSGFQGRASMAQGGDADVGVYYDGGMGDFKVAGAVGYYMNNDATDFRGAALTSTSNNADKDNLAASVSVAHNSGLAGTVAYQRDSLDRQQSGVSDPTTYYAKVGYAWDAYELAADYGKAEDYLKVASTNDSVTSMGLGAQYHLVDGVSVAALYRNFDAKQGATELDSINMYGVNMRVKF